ncbi:MAG: TetR/AcrR family transcriptional regulator [Oxalobacteraceae bacterium]|nr:MAG: TetR/AcrR family transcriptional regulator [Oxalobacteraceae bacterium]
MQCNDMDLRASPLGTGWRLETNPPRPSVAGSARMLREANHLLYRDPMKEAERKLRRASNPAGLGDGNRGRALENGRSSQADLPFPAMSNGRRGGRVTVVELERRRRRVLAVAQALFVRQGYVATTLMQIAQVSGVSIRTINHRIGDKDDIFREVVEHLCGAIRPVLTHNQGDDLAASLRSAAAYLLDTASQATSIDMFRLLIAERERCPDFVAAVSYRISRRCRNSTRDYFKELAACGLLLHRDRRLLVNVFIDLFLGSRALMSYIGWRQTPGTEEEIRAKVDFFLQAIR